MPTLSLSAEATLIRKEGDVIRRFGETPKAGITYRHRAGVYAILPRDGRLLLTFQESPLPELQLPGGGVEVDETPLQALHREVLEETGWRISRPRRLGAFRRFTYMPEYEKWAEKLCVIYTARPTHPLGEPTEAGHSTFWVPPDRAVRELANTGDRHFVRLWTGRP